MSKTSTGKFETSNEEHHHYPLPNILFLFVVDAALERVADGRLRLYFYFRKPEGWQGENMGMKFDMDTRAKKQ